MKLILIILSVLLSVSVAAQEVPVQPVEEPKPESSQEVPADFSEYMHRLYPQLDLKNEHDLFNLKSYADADKRHKYTEEMTQVMQMYFNVLDMGSMFAKLFDQYSRGKLADDPTFRCLYAASMLYFPPGRGNLEKAKTGLLALGAEIKDYAFPHYFLAEVYTEHVRRRAATVEEALVHVNRALEIRPQFKRAQLLKSRLMLYANPPNLGAATALLKPLTIDTAIDADLIEDIYAQYFNATDFDKTKAQAELMFTQSTLHISARTRISLVLGSILWQKKRPDEAIEWLNKALELSDTERNPEITIRIHETTGATWGAMAKVLRKKDPKLEGENSTLYEKYIVAAGDNHRKSAEIEAKYLPLIMRGSRALTYVVFLTQGMGEPEEALTWLENYLAEIDLTVRRREVLEGVVRDIKNKLHPTELGYLEQIDSNIKAKNEEKLMATLYSIGNQVRDGLHFNLQRSFKLFLSLLDHQNRVVVAYSAFLLEDTARTIGGEAINQAGSGLSVRLEKETECVSNDQSAIQEALHIAIRRLGHLPSWARAIKHAKAMIDTIGDVPEIDGPLKNVNSVWFVDEALGAVPNAPQKPDRSDRGDIDEMKDWWDKFTKAVEAEIAAKTPKED